MADILHQFRIKASASSVYAAFTEPIHLNCWWPAQSSGMPKEGEIYALQFGPEYDWRAKVVHALPGKAFTWKMIQAMDDWMGTEVGIRLTEDKGGTVIDFFHTGWPEANDHYRISNFCWGYLLAGLKKYVEDGVVIPFEERN